MKNILILNLKIKFYMKVIQINLIVKMKMRLKQKICMKYKNRINLILKIAQFIKKFNSFKIFFNKEGRINKTTMKKRNYNNKNY